MTIDDTIASQLTRLSDALDDQISALAAKGVTATGHGEEDIGDDIRSIEQPFIVTLSWDSQENMYVPDCTYAQAYAAYQAGKTIAFECGEDDGYAPYFGVYSEDDSCFVYGVLKPFDSSSPSYHWGFQTYGYFWTSEGVELDDNQIIYSMYGATATAAEIASGSYAFISSGLVTGTATRRTSSDLSASGATVSVPAGYYASATSKSVASGTAGTPTATKGTVSNHAVTVTPSVTNTAGYISGGTKTGTGVSVTASELVSGTYTVDSSGTKDVTTYASASVPAGTAGTPTATKGAVSNHAVSVTPSVTNAAGYISGGTKTGTGVSVTAAELVSGSETKTQNGTYNVTNLASLVVNVPSGGISKTVAADAYTFDVEDDDGSKLVTYGLNEANAVMDLGNTYKVTYNNTEYTCVAGTSSSGDVGVGSLTYSFTDYPFFITTYQGGGGGISGWWAVKRGSGGIGYKTIKVEEVEEGFFTAETLNVSANGTYNAPAGKVYDSVVVAVPSPTYSTIRTGSTAPSSSLGVDGDVYIQV